MTGMEEYEELSPRFRDELYARMNTQTPFWTLLGMEIVSAKKGWAKLRVPYSEKLANANGSAHGGSIFSPADSAVGIALAGLLSPEESISTVEMKINYIRPFNSGEMFAEARIIHKGTHTAVGDVVVSDSLGNIIAKGIGTYIISRR